MSNIQSLNYKRNHGLATQHDSVQRTNKRIPVPKPDLTEEQKNDLKKAFGTFDKSGVGLINSRSLLISLRAMGFRPTMASCNKYIESMIPPSDAAELDFKDYYLLMSTKMRNNDKISEIKLMFQSLCNDKGVITLDTLIAAREALNESVSMDELGEMITYGGSSKTKKHVTLDDFIKIMTFKEWHDQ